MALQDIMDECVSVTSGIAGAGFVRDWEVVAFDENAVMSYFYTASEEINAVEIVRRATPASYFANAKTQFDHEIAFNIYRGVGIANPMVTRREHVAFTQLIVNTFRVLPRLNGVAERILPMSIEIDAYTMKAGNLWHYALGVLPVREDVQ